MDDKDLTNFAKENFTPCDHENMKSIALQFHLNLKHLKHITMTWGGMLLEGELTPARFPSWCNVFDNNVVVLDEKIPYES